MTPILSAILAPPSTSQTGGVLQRAEGGEFGCNEKPGICGTQSGDGIDRSVGAVTGAEGIIDVMIAEAGENRCQLTVVLLLSRIEAEVLEECDCSRGEARYRVHRSLVGRHRLEERDVGGDHPR